MVQVVVAASSLPDYFLFFIYFYSFVDLVIPYIMLDNDTGYCLPCFFVGIFTWLWF